MVRITGRYKELIIGASGENIALVPLEGNIKKLLPGVNEVMMVAISASTTWTAPH